jgi:hypothetical protein
MSAQPSADRPARQSTRHRRQVAASSAVVVMVIGLVTLVTIGPLTTGVAALVRQHYHTASVATVKSLIVNGASNVTIGNDATSPQKVLFSRVP